jgi:Flp pilus assembly protein TadG
MFFNTSIDNDLQTIYTSDVPVRTQMSGSCPAGRTGGRKGSAVVEFAFLLPWFLFIFVGVLDMGFYNYALVTTESAARVAAISASASTTTASDSATACNFALQELASNINMSGIGACGAGSPVTVTATSVTGPDGQPAAKVTVLFTTPQLIPVPGLLPAQITLVRAVTMKLRS